tara:strand:- start:1374 stop:2120 length:747 start_codon:yes stop_codon:yes gene_type:complete
MPSQTGNHYVLLTLASRSNNESDLRYNRVALKAETISISTNKDVMAIPVPFSGISGGEATKVALDFGVATKTISLSGVITSQDVYKEFHKKDKSYFTDNSFTDPVMDANNRIKVNMGSHEVSQLIHSYVDSSFRQKQQNFNELIILIKSKVNKDFQYYSGVTEQSDIEDAKTIPFTYKVRDGDGGRLDDKQSGGSFGDSEWPDTLENDTSNLIGITGFIRSFSTTFTPGQNFVEFSLDFEQATNALGR